MSQRGTTLILFSLVFVQHILKHRAEQQQQQPQCNERVQLQPNENTTRTTTTAGKFQTTQTS